MYGELEMFTCCGSSPLDSYEPLGKIAKMVTVYRPFGKTVVLLKIVIALPPLMASTLPTATPAELVMLREQPLLVELKANVHQNSIVPIN